MTDTIRTLSELQAFFADNYTGDITAQNVRDFLVTTYDWAVTKDPQLAAANTFTAGPQTVSINSPSNKGIVVQAASSQSANLLELQNSSGTALLSVSSSGELTGSNDVLSVRNGSNRQLLRVYSHSTYYIEIGTNWAGTEYPAITGSTAAPLIISSSTYGLFAGVGGTPTLFISPTINLISAYSSSTAGLSVRGVASQTANLQEWQNSSGTVLSGVSNNGYSGFGVAPSNTTGLSATLTTASHVGLKITGASGHTDNYLQCVDGNGTTVFSFSSNRSANSDPQLNLLTNLGHSNLLTYGEGGVTNGYNLRLRGYTALTKDAYVFADTVNSRAGFTYNRPSNASNTAGSEWRLTATSLTGIVADGSASYSLLTLSTSTQNALVTCSAANVIGLVVKAAASQTANLTEWQNSSGTTITVVDASGNIGIGAAPTNTSQLDVVASQPYARLKSTGSGYCFFGLESSGSVATLLSYGAGGYFGIAPTGTTSFIPWKLFTSGNVVMAPAIQTSGSPTLLTITAPAHTTLTASTEAIDVNFNLNRTVQFATGALTTQRAISISSPTYAFVGSSTLTTAVTLDINGSPVAGTNAAITNSIAQRINVVNASDIGLEISCNGGSTSVGSMLRVRNTNGSVSLTIDRGGNISALSASATWDAGSGGFVRSSGGTGTLGGTGTNRWGTAYIYTLDLLATNSSTVPLTVKAAASQTANLQEWQDSSGTVLSRFSSNGYLYCGTIINNATVWQNDNFYYSASNNIRLTYSNLDISAFVLNTRFFRLNGVTTALAYSASSIPFNVSGTTSQTATLIQLQGTSSTTAGTAQAEVDTAWVDSTHATRKARLLLRAYDTAAREGLRIDADGSYALTAIGGGTVTASTALTVTSPATTYVPLVVDSPASQSADLQQWKVNGTTKVAFNSAGTLTKTTATGATNTVYADFKNQNGTSCWKITEAGGLSVGVVTTLLASAQATLSTSNGSITLAVGGNTDSTNIISLNSPGTLVSDTLASAIALRVRGTTSQTATLIQLQGTSSTTAGTAQAEVDTAWVDSTHATRKARLLLRAYDTAVREGLRIDADGSYALTAIGGGAVTASTALTVASPTATYVPCVVKGASSQSANLQEWQNSSGAATAKVSFTGQVFSTGSFTCIGGGGVTNANGGGYDGVILWANGGGGISLKSQSSSSGVVVDGTTNTGTGVVQFAVRGFTGQTAPLIQLQGTSSTTAGTAQAEVDTAWIDSTHATRKARLLLRVYDTAVREGLRIDANGTYALTAIGGGAVTASTALTVASPTATYVPCMVKGASSQSANLQEWQNSSGTVLVRVTSAGQIRAGSGDLSLGGGGTTVEMSGGTLAVSSSNAIAWSGGGYNWSSSGSVTGSSTSDTGLKRSSAGVVTVSDGSTGFGSLLLTAASASTVPCTVKAAASQSANLQEWQNSAGTVLASVAASGMFKMNSHYGDITTNADGATITFDLSVSDKHTVTLGGDRTLALSNGQTGQSFLIILEQDGTGGHSVTWWSGILWSGGTPPTLTATASKKDIFSFLNLGSGVYLGFTVGQDF